MRIFAAVMKPLLFHSLSTEVIDLLRAYTLRSPYRNCDFAVPNMLCWQFLYDTEYACVADFLVLRFHFGAHRRLAYMAPVGTGDLRTVLSLMANDAAAMGEDLCLCGVSDALKAQLETLLPKGFHYINDRDYNDYIYLRTALATLSGKHLQSKRNHVNQFLRLTPHYQYRPLAASDAAECLTLAQSWLDRQTLDDGQDDELRAIRFAFAHYDLLGLRGGRLDVDGRLVAFTYGSPVNADTFAVHVEKADPQVEGAYTMVNKCFAASLPEQYTYVNREEDLGIEGLRKAKLSYHPAELLHKWMVVQRQEVWSDERLRAALTALWVDAFHDDEAFITEFFNTRYSRDRVLYTLQDGALVAALHLLPVQLDEHPGVRAVYLYAVSTRSDYRGRGLMTALLDRARHHLRAESYDVAVLLPANVALTALYRRVGYQAMPGWWAHCDEAYRFLHDDDVAVAGVPFMALKLSDTTLPDSVTLRF